MRALHKAQMPWLGAFQPPLLNTTTQPALNSPVPQTLRANTNTLATTICASIGTTAHNIFTPTCRSSLARLRLLSAASPLEARLTLTTLLPRYALHESTCVYMFMSCPCSICPLASTRRRPSGRSILPSSVSAFPFLSSRRTGNCEYSCTPPFRQAICLPPPCVAFEHDSTNSQLIRSRKASAGSA